MSPGRATPSRHPFADPVRTGSTVRFPLTTPRSTATPEMTVRPLDRWTGTIDSDVESSGATPARGLLSPLRPNGPAGRWLPDSFLAVRAWPTYGTTGFFLSRRIPERPGRRVANTPVPGDGSTRAGRALRTHSPTICLHTILSTGPGRPDCLGVEAGPRSLTPFRGRAWDDRRRGSVVRRELSSERRLPGYGRSPGI
jgi:hypothetical protein